MLRQRWRLVVIVTLSFATVAALLDLRTDTSYLVTAKVRLGSATPNAELIGLSRPLPADVPEAEATRALLPLRTPAVLQAVARDLQVRHPGTSFGHGVIGGLTAPGVLEVGVRHFDPRQGAHVARALARALVRYLRRNAQRRLSLVAARLREAGKAELGPPQDDLLLGQRRRESILSSLDIAKEVTQPAEVITPPVAREVTDAFEPVPRVPAALLFGLCLSLLAAVLLDAVERRPRNPDRLAAAVGLPLAALLGRPGRDAFEGSSFQILRNAVAALTGRPHVIVLTTSAAPGDGKTTVALGLARAIAEAGRTVALVEADLRRPTLRDRLGLTGPGLAEILAGHVPGDDPPAADPATGDADPATGDALYVLHSGDPPVRPLELLRSARMGELLRSLAEERDVVVVDAPPVLAGADAALMAPHADLVLLCARAGRTPRDELVAAREALERVGAPEIALVIGDVTTPHALVGAGARQKRPAGRLARSMG